MVDIIIDKYISCNLLLKIYYIINNNNILNSK